MTTGAHEQATRSRRDPTGPGRGAAHAQQPGVGDDAERLPGPVSRPSDAERVTGPVSRPSVAARLAEVTGDRVAALVGDLVDDLRRTTPGVVEGVWLLGSAAAGDHHPDLDDVDVLVVLTGTPDPLLRRLLDDVHQRVERAHPGLRPEVVYATWPDLRSTPPVPGYGGGRGHGLVRRDGQTLEGPEHAPSAVTRAQLLGHGLAVAGPWASATDAALADRVAVSRAALTAHCLAEIATRWTPWWERSVLLLSSAGAASLRPEVTDAVLRIARVHHTLVSGEVRSLVEVGEWALTVCEPPWTRLLEESLRVRLRPRERSLYRSGLARRRDALAFTDLLMTADEETYGTVAERTAPARPRQPGAGRPDARDGSAGRR